jgi:Glycosyltransferase like family
MFSILICSVNASHLERLKINIHATAGIEYELLVWDNLNDPKPITEVYNLLAARARYPYFCFIHEDIAFKTQDWLSVLLTAFEQHPETGLIGIAGAKYKSRTPSGWSTGIPDLDFSNIYHQDKNGHTIHLYSNSSQSSLEPVVNVDGVFIAIRREVWDMAKFNTDILRGFHLYDIDFSFRVFKNWKAAVIFNIDILHFTQGGSFGNEWLLNTLQWHKHFAHKLPQAADDVNVTSALEKRIGRNWLYRLRSEDISFKNKRKWVRASGMMKYPPAWPYIFLFFFGKNYKKQRLGRT